MVTQQPLITPEGLIARSMARKIQKIIDEDTHVGHFGILATSVTNFDPYQLIRSVGQLRNNGRKLRLAVALNKEYSDLAEVAVEAGFLPEEDAFATDLLVAGRWRNTPNVEDIPIAIATGEQSTLHTLAAFTEITSTEVAVELLYWAAIVGNVAVNSQQSQLFEALSSSEFAELHSPLSVSTYIAELLKYDKVPRLEAVKDELPLLGLLRDPDVFGKGGVKERLRKNLELCRKIRYFPKTEQHSIRNRVLQFPQLQREELLGTLTNVENWQRSAYDPAFFQHLTFQQIYDLTLLKPPRKTKDQTETAPDLDVGADDENATPPPLQRTFAEALLDSDEASRKNIAEAVSEAIETKSARDGQPVVAVRTDELEFEFPLRTDAKLLQFAHTFCAEGSWGGVVESEHKTLRGSIDLYNQTGAILSPYKAVSVISDDTTLIELIERLDDCLSPHEPVLMPAFRLYEQERRALIPLIDGLVLQPFVTIGATPERRLRFKSYLDSANDLLRLLKENFEKLNAISGKALRICIAYILALDTVLVKARIEQVTAHKAILMPLHPLHLWKFVRLIEIYESGVNDLTAEDREAILSEAENERHFLHTLYISEILTDGQAVALPFAGAIESLPCYENTSNHYSGNDGLHSLFYTLERFIAFYPLFVRPLRFTVIDVPSLPDFLAEVARFLNKYSSERLPSVDIRLYFTAVSAARSYLASLITGENERIYQEFVALGRLTLRIEPNPTTFNDILETHKRYPAHLIAMFDQSELAVRDFRRQQIFVGESPFCITREYQYDQVMDEFQAVPVNDARLFAHYNDLVNRLRHNLSSYSTGVIGKTQAFRDQLDVMLKEECAQWLFLADRVLPTENHLSSPRIYARHDGRREVLVLASTSDHFARELEFQLKKGYNLYPEREQIQGLLLDFSHMIGDGLLSIIQAKDGTLMESKSLGLIGLLVATRSYVQTNPDALVVAVDSQDSLRWLRVTDARKRADLIGLRRNGQGHFIVEAIEVKTFETEEEIFTRKGNVIKGKAVDQVASIVGALKQTFEQPDSPLTPPRREVLRDLFYTECQSRRHSREFRSQWAKLLDEIFSQQVVVEVAACVYRIDLSHNQQGGPEILRGDIGSPDYLEVTYITLGEKQVQRLIAGYSTDYDVPNLEEESFEPIIGVPGTSRYSEKPISKSEVTTGSQNITPIGNPKRPVKEPNDENMVDRAWIQQVLSSFVRACEYYDITITHSDPDEAIIGPSIVRFPFRLARGTRREKLDRNLEDIGREIAISSLIVQSVPNSHNLMLDVPRPERIIPYFIPQGRDALPPIQSIEELPLALGLTPSGEPYTTDLKSLVHMLVGGTTGAGKTIFLYTAMLSLLYRHPLADDLQLVLCTSKLEDFAFFEGLPHLFGHGIITDADTAIDVIGEIANQELENRSQILAQGRVRSVEEYNRAVSREQQLRPIVVMVDEFADLADQVAQDRAARTELYTNIRRIAQAGRSRSVHLILCTQRPTSDLFPSNIKTLMNARVAFRMNSQTDSRTILDSGGAENLLGKGDMLFKTGGVVERLQGFYVQTDDIRND